MKIANCTLKLRPTWTVPIVNVTPAEVQFLVAEHQRNAKGLAVEIDEASVSEVERGERDEISRLLGKYNRTRLLAMYPKASFRLPPDFKTALDVGMDVELPPSQFSNSDEEPKPPRKGDE